MKAENIRLNAEWRKIYKEILPSYCSVMILGDVDTGKTTFAQHLIYRLLSDNKRVHFVDSDIGQSTISPPSTVGIKSLNSKPEDIEIVKCDTMYFVGDITPSGHLLQLLTGVKLAFEKADSSKSQGYIVIDTTGLVRSSIGNELKIQKIKLIQPDVIVAIQKKQELEPILNNFSNSSRIRIFKASPYMVKHKSRSERKQNRYQKLSSYFKNSKVKEVNLKKQGFSGRIHSLNELKEKKLHNCIVGLCDLNNQTIGLGIVKKMTSKTKLVINTPIEKISEVKNVHFGSFYLKRINKKV